MAFFFGDSEQARNFQMFQFGTPIDMEAGKSYNLDFSYVLDGGVVTAYANQKWNSGRDQLPCEYGGEMG